MRSNPKSSFPQTTAQFNLSLNFEVNLNADSVGTPHSFNLLETKDFNVINFNPSYKFLNDLICGLQFHKMNEFSFLNLQEKTFVHKALLELDPYHQIYSKCSHQLKSTLSSFEKTSTAKTLQIENLEKTLTDFFLTVFNTRRFQLM